jgi:hypothetical protein
MITNEKTTQMKKTRDILASWLGAAEACLDKRACTELSSMIISIDDHVAESQRALVAQFKAGQAYEVGILRRVLHNQSMMLSAAEFCKLMLYMRDERELNPVADGGEKT